MSKLLTESVLARLTMQGIATFLGEGEKSECVAFPGASLALCHEPVTDLNYVVAGHGANQGDHFRTLCRSALSARFAWSSSSLAFLSTYIGAAISTSARVNGSGT